MSNKPEPKVYDDVSLDEFVLVSVMRSLEMAKDALLASDLNAAIYNLNYAWTIVPKSIRLKMTSPPSEIINQRVKNEIPLRHAILSRKDWLYSIDRHDVDIKSEEYPELTEREIRTLIYQEKMTELIVQQVHLAFELELVNAMDDAGVYINKKRHGVIATADRTPDQPLPTFSKLPAAIPRK